MTIPPEMGRVVIEEQLRAGEYAGTFAVLRTPFTWMSVLTADRIGLICTCGNTAEKACIALAETFEDRADAERDTALSNFYTEVARAAAAWSERPF